LSVDRCGPAFYRSDDIRNELQIDAEPHTGNFHTVCTAQRRSVLSLRFCIAWSQWWMFYAVYTLYGFMKLKSTTMNLQHATYSYRSYRKVSHTKVCGVLQSKAASLNAIFRTSCSQKYLLFFFRITTRKITEFEQNFQQIHVLRIEGWFYKHYWLTFAFKFIHCSGSYARKQKVCFVNAL